MSRPYRTTEFVGLLERFGSEIEMSGISWHTRAVNLDWLAISREWVDQHRASEMELRRLSRDHPDLRGINPIQRIVIAKHLMK
ncbi:MAG: hypothetical protein ACR2H3_04490 [Acidimicrobiales bacterium]